MISFLWIGTGVGALVGLLHALHVVSTRWGRPGLDPKKTIWHGFWTWLLWTLFGAYVLAFWLIGLFCLGATRLFRTSDDAA